MNELFSVEKPLTVYNEFRAQLAEWKALNEKTVFDYESPKGNKEARSHIYKMRQSKAAVEKARKKEKQSALDYGRMVDAEAKEIVGEIEDMIQVHQEPIDAIEQREKDRVAAHQAKLDDLKMLLDTDYSQSPSHDLKTQLENLAGVEPDERYEEFAAEAITLWKRVTEKVSQALTAREKYESEQAELERLRQEAAEREQKERDARIAQEAAERAKREAEEKAEAESKAAEAKAKAEREASERRELDLKLAAERAEREKLEAEQRAIQAEEQAKANAAREAEEKIQREKAEAEKREANKRHKGKIHREALAGLMADKFISEDQAKAVISLIANGKVPHTKIIY